MPVEFDISTINPKQEQFFKSTARFIAYGGARGGGKSWSVQKKSSLLAMHYVGAKVLILRRTYKDLERNHVRVMEPMLAGIAKYRRQDKVFVFPNGSIIELGYCASESDLLQYQGQEYDFIFIDEATQFPFEYFDVLKACIRGANKIPKRMYLTCNPGGVGHEWVKRLFVSKQYKDGERAEDYEFIAATVYDNKVLIDNDPGYIDMLNSLDPTLREMWRDGNWDVLAGRYFNEFDRQIHVIDPFALPEHWRRYRAIDYGLDCCACVWVAADERGCLYVYRDYAEEDKTISDGAKDILDLSEGETIEYTIAPDDLWGRSQESGKTKAELFREAGLDMVKGSRNREAGWLAIKELLKPTEVSEGVYDCKMRIFSSCGTLIEHLPALQRDRKRPTDCATEPHDITHVPDALRYFALQYIVPSKGAYKPETALEKYRRKALKGAKRKKYY